jgi:alkylation response protein AidB-like acyl-CoA dehydrogenase
MVVPDLVQTGVDGADVRSTIAFKLDEGLTDDLLTPDEKGVRRKTREVVATSIAPYAEGVAAGGRSAVEGCLDLLRAGLGGLLFPTTYGGTAASTVSYAIAVEEVSRVCPSTSLVFVTQTHAGYPILVGGSEEQMLTWLPRLISGDILGSLAITEPSAGSDVAQLKTRARHQGDVYVLDGAKAFITTGDRAGVIVCFATVDPRRGRDGVTAFLIPGDAMGLRRGRVLQKLGMHGSSTAELFFDAVQLPETSRLGDEGGAWELSMRTVVKSRISAAAQGLGIAVGAYAVGLGYAASIGMLRGHQHQEVQFVLADLRTQIISARLLLHTVARAVDAYGAGSSSGLVAEVAMAKCVCTDLAVAASDTVVELLGPIGDLVCGGAERFLRDAKVTQIYDGTNQVQRMLIARDIASRLAGEP